MTDATTRLDIVALRERAERAEADAACPFCGGLGYSDVGVGRVSCEHCGGSGRALAARLAALLPPEDVG